MPLYGGRRNHASLRRKPYYFTTCLYLVGDAIMRLYMGNSLFTLKRASAWW
jgi:hypothetical protein